MRTRLVVMALAGLVLARPAAAQKTEDQARLIFTVGLSYTGSSSLWSVEGQPILRPAIGSDTVDLTRTIGGSAGLVFSGMYFPKPALGFVGEAFFMGIGLHDQCSVTSANPDPRTEDICTDIDGSSKSSSAVLLSAGPVIRAASSHEISPYARAQVGMLISNLSPIRTEGAVNTGDIFIIYDDPSSTRVTLGFVFGGGATAVLGKGWQLRLEGRDNLVQIATVAGPTGAGDANPEVVNTWKNLFSIVLGVDVVLEKKSAAIATEPVRGAILAGGEATRYGGRPKGLEVVGGRRILDRLVDAFVSAFGESPLLVANDPDATTWHPALTVRADVRPGAGALGGILTAVTAAASPVVCVAWDMPFVPPALLRRLAAGLETADAVLPSSGGRRGVEPMCAGYGPACGPAIERAIADGDLRAIAFHSAVRTCILPPEAVAACGDPAILFFNVNTPDDLQQADALWRRLASSRS